MLSVSKTSSIGDRGRNSKTEQAIGFSVSSGPSELSVRRTVQGKDLRSLPLVCPLRLLKDRHVNEWEKGKSRGLKP